MKYKKTLALAFKASLPVMAGYLVLGAGFGILMDSKGYGWGWSALMSLAVYAGSMQYVTVELLSSGATLIAAALMTLMVNFRHLFYGVAMLDEYSKAGREKPYLIFALTDETFSIVCSSELPEGVDRRKYNLLVSLLNQCYWVVGSALGGLLGAAISFNSAGVDFAMTALFVVIFVEQWEKKQNRLPALIGLGASLVSLLIFGPDGFIIPAMALIAAALLLGRKWMGGKRDE